MIKKFDSETAERGQEVREEVYDEFLNVLPPISLKGGQGWHTGFQMGEPSCYREDTRTGDHRKCYMTFTSRDGRYYYQGVNFAGEVDSRPHMKGEVK